jgi:hypothetical protein
MTKFLIWVSFPLLEVLWPKKLDDLKLNMKREIHKIKIKILEFFSSFWKFRFF